MGRRIYYEGAVYHVISRGNNRKYILESDENKICFLASLAKYKERFGFKLYAFVLMDNHFHMVIESSFKHNISRIMQPLLLSYSKKYCVNHQYVGHLWQGPFKSKPILRESYIRESIDYVHENPVRAKMVKKPEDYRWSSARYYQGLENQVVDELIGIDEFRLLA